MDPQRLHQTQPHKLLVAASLLHHLDQPQMSTLTIVVAVAVYLLGVSFSMQHPSLSFCCSCLMPSPQEAQA
jgi:hypothetical protein